MKIVKGFKHSLSAVRWKMLAIFVVLSLISTFLVGCCAAALLNVVIRRANASPVEERVQAVVDSWSRFTPLLLERVPCGAATTNVTLAHSYPVAMWSEGKISVTVFPRRAHAATTADTRFDDASYASLVNDRGTLEIRAVQSAEREECSVSVMVQIPLTESLLKRLSRDVGLELSGARTVLMQRYREQRGFAGEIEANFIPGSGWPIPVLVSARNLETGRAEDWTVGQLTPHLTRTVGELSRMGL